MPVIRDIPLSLKSRDVLRREGFTEQTEVRPEIKSIILELLASVKKTHLLEPAIAYKIYTITEMNQVQLSIEGNFVIHGKLLPSFLHEATELAIVVGTIGSRVEKKATNYFEQGDPLRGLLLDGIGSAAIDSITQQICKFMADEALARGCQISSPINPGMPGLPLAEQWQLLKIVPAWEIGVRLNSSGIMIPRKSTSMVMGIGPQMKKWTQAEVCAHCSLRETCHYKVTK